MKTQAMHWCFWPVHCHDVQRVKNAMALSLSVKQKGSMLAALAENRVLGY